MTVRYVPDCGTQEMFDWLRRPHRWLSLDLETGGRDTLNPWVGHPKLVSIGNTENAYAFPYDKNLTQMVLDRAPIPLVNQNIKFDAQFLHVQGNRTDAMVDDTKAMLHFIDSRIVKLKPAADHYLHAGASDAERELKKLFRKNKWTWDTVPVDTFEYWWYGGMDTILTSQLADMHFPTIQAKYADLYDMEIDVLWLIADAERRGMRLDVDYCQQEAEKLRAAQEAIQAPYPFSLGGKKDLIPALEDRGIRIGRTEAGNPSITEDVLLPYKGDELVDDVLEFRRLDKLAGTYFEAYLDVVYTDGRVHPTINTIGPRTGRMSSDHPNMQNVPKRAEGDYVRRAFMPSEGNVFVLADYAQIEYRLFAAAANEPEMIQAFLDGKDMHAVTAELALGYPVSKDMPERDMAKNGNFAELYMAGLEKFAKTAGITVDMARDFRTKYHAAFTRIKPFTRAVMTYAKKNGMSVQTMFGRDIPVDDGFIYAGINYMIQGTAADILKRALVTLKGSEFADYLVLPVHDELIFDVPEELAPQLAAALPKIMEDRETFAVPIEVEVKTQKRWGES